LDGSSGGGMGSDLCGGFGPFGMGDWGRLLGGSFVVGWKRVGGEIGVGPGALHCVGAVVVFFLFFLLCPWCVFLSFFLVVFWFCWSFFIFLLVCIYVSYSLSAALFCVLFFVSLYFFGLLGVLGFGNWGSFGRGFLSFAFCSWDSW